MAQVVITFQQRQISQWFLLRDSPRITKPLFARKLAIMGSDKHLNGTHVAVSLGLHFLRNDSSHNWLGNRAEFSWRDLSHLTPGCASEAIRVSETVVKPTHVSFFV